MHVVRSGTLLKPEIWKANVDCKCGAVLNISLEDLHNFHYYGTHFKHGYVGFRCPECGNVVPVSNAPREVRAKVVDKSRFDGYDDR